MPLQRKPDSIAKWPPLRNLAARVEARRQARALLDQFWETREANRTYLHGEQVRGLSSSYTLPRMERAAS